MAQIVSVDQPLLLCWGLFLLNEKVNTYCMIWYRTSFPVLIPYSITNDLELLYCILELGFIFVELRSKHLVPTITDLK